MTAALRSVGGRSEIDSLIERIKNTARDLERASRDVEHAADEAVCAAEDVRAAARGEIDEAHLQKTVRELAELVVGLHNDTHAGLVRWCEHEVCRKAWEVLS
ncbi:hypothetical protein Lesp02_70340 [Lentzea sp. NBRC 105346]|uniref:hypothetical protein n=1 Tax=Lentzea sp. NBRC 105346 TaxID=3032205 RepID=UPI0024A02A1F|nr:hypothetical protein [Lentzea sp. NBRC 105346]GLZ34847.1 hypothetical protein Lesp02_70340 [Lentzea sp. NBRC 105346]